MTVTSARVEPSGRRAARVLGVGTALLWLVLPVIPLLLWAFAARWSFPAVLPSDWTLTGWRAAADQGAVSAATRSVGLGLAVAALATPAGAMAGRALAAHPFPFSPVVEAVLIAPVAVPPFAVVMGLNVLALRTGVPQELALVLVLVVAAIPYTTYVMRAAYAGYDFGYEDEARTLGATARHVLVHVHLPLVAPALSAAAFLAFLVGWSDYVVTLIVGGGGLVTLPMLVGALASASGNDGVVAVVSLAAVLPPVLLLLCIGLLARRGRLP